MSIFVDLGALPVDCDGGIAVALVRRDELDVAVTAVAVPVHKSRYPLECLRLAGEPGLIQSLSQSPLSKVLNCGVLEGIASIPCLNSLLPQLILI